MKKPVFVSRQLVALSNHRLYRVVRRQLVWRRSVFVMAVGFLLFVIFDAVPQSSAWASAPAGLVDVHLTHVKSHVTLHYDGQEKIFWARATTIEGAIKESEIRFATYDATEPALDTLLTGEPVDVVVRRAHPITIVDNGVTYETYTAFATVRDILTQLKFELFGEDLITPSVDAQVDANTKIIIVRSAAVHIEKDGQIQDLHTNANTVEEVLQEAKIDLSGYRVEPTLTTRVEPGMKVRVIHLGEEEVHEVSKIAYRTIDKNDNTLLLGQVRVAQTGKEGRRERVYKVFREDGVETKRTLLSDTIAEQPQDRIVLHGTKVLIGQTQYGLASWYGSDGFTAAHRTFKKGTRLRVTNQENGKTVDVTVVGYGPQASTGRVIDLSPSAFGVLAPLGKGVISVKIEELL